MDSALKERIRKIKVLALDVDGVLSDGKIIIDNSGGEIKNFDVQDGFGLVLLRRAGFKIVVITARDSKPVDFRAKDLKIDKVYQNAFPKVESYKQMLKEFDVCDEEVCFVGDDLPDFTVLRQVGFAVAVSNAVCEIKETAHYVTRKSGGNGAVREVVELILKTQGKWDEIVAAL